MQWTSVKISTKDSLEGHELNMQNCSFRGKVWKQKLERSGLTKGEECYARAPRLRSLCISSRSLPRVKVVRKRNRIQGDVVSFPKRLASHQNSRLPSRSLGDNGKDLPEEISEVLTLIFYPQFLGKN